MRNCWECFKSKHFLWFAAGAASVLAGKSIIKSESARKACVKTMAKAIKLQNDAQEAFQNMKEDAEDLCYDARQESEEQIEEA